MRNSKESELILVGASTIHGRGVYAKSRIPKGTYIIEYTGEKISSKEGTRRDKLQIKKGQFYVFELNSRYCIDGATGGDARLINHSCNPNCRYQRRKGKIWIESIRHIKTGEEITYNYDAGGKHLCKCGAKRCKGVM